MGNSFRCEKLSTSSYVESSLRQVSYRYGPRSSFEFWDSAKDTKDTKDAKELRLRVQ
jgi:hypothetical protein